MIINPNRPDQDTVTRISDDDRLIHTSNPLPGRRAHGNENPFRFPFQGGKVFMNAPVGLQGGSTRTGESPRSRL